MLNIKEISLINLSEIKSVFVLSIATKMLLLESLTIAHCNEMKHIIVDIGNSGTGVNIVFPKLKRLQIFLCEKLEYIFFGQINANDHHHENHLHLPSLQCLQFNNLPSLIGMGTKNYHTMLSRLEVISLIECPQLVANESIGDQNSMHMHTQSKGLFGLILINSFIF
jgi:hypothetical protein